MYRKSDTGSPFEELERGVHAALETYSNVHRGSGHNSMVSTYLYEKARDIVLEYLGLNKSIYIVVFCSPSGAGVLKERLKPGTYHCLSSHSIGLPLGIRALAIKKKSLPEGIPLRTGGGTARLVSPGWVIWARGAEKFEAGTPPIINVIAFAKALQLMKSHGNDAFRLTPAVTLTATEILHSDELEKYSGRELMNELRRTLIGKDLVVPTLEGARPFINFDNSASTQTFQPVWNTVRQTWHQQSQVHQELIHEVRSVCADFFGAPLSSYDILFTSNTTESINISAHNFGLEKEQDVEPIVLSTFMEHSSNDLPWRMIPGYGMIRLSVDSEGFIDLNELESVLSDYNQKHVHGNKRIRLMAVSGASNVMGSFNDLEAISQIVHKYRARLLVDAAQLVAHRRINIEQSAIDYLALSAHKVYAPFGTGVLVVRKGLLNFNSSELEIIKSSGEENATGIAALGKSLLLLNRIGMDLIQEEEQTMTRLVLNKMSQIPGLMIFGIKEPGSQRFSRKGGVIVFAIKGIMANKLAKLIAEKGGIGVRAGCHCAHMMIKKLVGVPPMLEKFQGLIVTLFPRLSLPGLARVSIGIGNTEKDIDTLIEVLASVSGKPQATSERQPGSSNNHNTVLSQTEIKQQINDFISNAAQRVYSN